MKCIVFGAGDQGARFVEGIGCGTEIITPGKLQKYYRFAAMLMGDVSSLTLSYFYRSNNE